MPVEYMFDYFGAHQLIRQPIPYSNSFKQKKTFLLPPHNFFPPVFMKLPRISIFHEVVLQYVKIACLPKFSLNILGYFNCALFILTCFPDTLPLWIHFLNNFTLPILTHSKDKLFIWYNITFKYLHGFSYKILFNLVLLFCLKSEEYSLKIYFPTY